MKKITIKWIKIFTIAIIALAVVVFGLAYYEYNGQVKKIAIEDKIERVKSSKDFVALDNVSKDFLSAIVAIEDHRFYSHGAVDFISIGRATLSNIVAGKVVQGGSTITQQLAKNLYLNNDRTIDRKIKEVLISYDLERKYSKEEILELYINVIYYGDGNRGINQASIGYFGKKPSQLTFDEATMLAGFPQAPSIYGSSENYELAKERQQKVIFALQKY